MGQVQGPSPIVSRLFIQSPPLPPTSFSVQRSKHNLTFSLNVRPSSAWRRDEKHSREGINRRPFSRPMETRLASKDRSGVVLEKSNCTTIRSSLRGRRRGRRRVLPYLTYSILARKYDYVFHVIAIRYRIEYFLGRWFVYFMRNIMLRTNFPFVDPFILSKEKEKVFQSRRSEDDR